ncbi:MAG TPA: TonB-dependent receptor [Bacteroidota bacterium]|nr:TonB-dependent receptor [Bacteroidota bacterium]
MKLQVSDLCQRLALVCLLVAVVMTAGKAHAAILTGQVVDKTTGEPIVGAMVFIKGSSLGVNTGLDGSYKMPVNAFGTFTVVFQHVAYETFEREIHIQTENQRVTVDASLTPKEIRVQGVEVVGRLDEESDVSARRSEKEAISALNLVSARSIEVSPDVTVANVMQRISGLSVERNNTGDGQYAIVRGMDKRYNYTKIDGIKVPSPDNKNRYVPLDIFPSDLLERLEVVKVLTPEMEGDAIGGVMNMIMKDAPPGFLFRMNASLGSSEFGLGQKFLSVPAAVQDKSPEQRMGKTYFARPEDFSTKLVTPGRASGTPNGLLGMSVGARILDDAVGLVAAGSYQHTQRGASSIFFETLVDQSNNLPTIQDISSRTYYAEQTRIGLHAKSDVFLSDAHRFDISGTFARLMLDEVRTMTDTSVNINKRQGYGTGDISNSLRLKQETQAVYSVALQGSHMLPYSAHLHWTLAYADAAQNEPDRTQVSVNSGVTRGSDGKLTQAPVLASGQSRRWTSNDDLDRTAKVDLTFQPHLFGLEIMWKSGAFYRSKTRSNYYDNYSLTPNPTRQEFSGDFADFTYSVDDPLGTPDDALNYSSHEYVTAWYSEAKTRIADLLLLGGLRMENTDFGWVTRAPSTVVGKTGSIRYTDLLPSLSLKYLLSETQNLRFAYFASISRPGFLEVIPYSITQEDYVEQGNPYLNRTQADNFDARYEYFPSPGEQILIGAFYKNITDPIEYTLQVKPPNIIYLMPGNFGVATNYGFELDLTKYFSDFGIKANYTYTNSAITTAKIFRFRDSNGNLTVRNDNQTRPLQGQSAHVGNCSFLYKNSVWGFEAQVSLVYTGSRIASVSPYKDNDLWQNSTLVTDFSLEQKLTDVLAVYAKANNIFDVPYKVEIRLNNPATVVDIPMQAPDQNIMVRKDTYGITFLVGLRLRL